MNFLGHIYISLKLRQKYDTNNRQKCWCALNWETTKPLTFYEALQCEITCQRKWEQIPIAAYGRGLHQTYYLT